MLFRSKGIRRRRFLGWQHLVKRIGGGGWGLGVVRVGGGRGPGEGSFDGRAANGGAAGSAESISRWLGVSNLLFSVTQKKVAGHCY